MRRAALRADSMLLLVAGLWGAGFVAQKHAMGSMGPFAFNGVRYAIGALLLAPLLAVALRRHKQARGRGPTRRDAPSPLSAGTALKGVLLGVVMFAAAGLQQTGIVSTTASRSAFLTGLYVLIVPAIGVVFRQRITAGHIVGGVLAVIGLTLLGVGGAGRHGTGGDPALDTLLSGFTLGDWLVLGCAVLWALHVVLTGHFAPRADPFALAWAQFVTVGVLSLVVAMATEPTTARGLAAGWLPLLYSGVFVIAIAFTLQIVAQKNAPPTHAAVLMSLEAVFGALFGMLLLRETLTGWEIAGCIVMFTGMLVSQLHRGERTTLERVEQQEPV